jgi:hypothetical protein
MRRIGRERKKVRARERDFSEGFFECKCILFDVLNS